METEMYTNVRTSRRLAAGSLATVVAVLVAANPAAATSPPAQDAVLTLDPASLPQTADAVDGWYDHGWTQQRSPDTDRGWFIQRKTGERIATQTGPSGSETTATSTTARPQNWRRLTNEIP
jgi:hypothetical protein